METTFDKYIMNDPIRRELFEKEYNELLLCELALEKAGVKPVIPIAYTYEEVVNERFAPQPEEVLTPEQERSLGVVRARALKLARKAVRTVKPGVILSGEEAERRLACL